MDFQYATVNMDISFSKQALQKIVNLI